jgi:opacity protein-like surface antigen
MAVDPAYDWSGFYVGGHLGYLWGKTRVVDDGILTEPGAPTNGVIGGVLAGYNWQLGPLVLGIEGDIGWTNAVGHGTALPPPPPIVITTTTPNTYELRWTSHVVGKAGYAAGNWLFFATGGLSIADLNFTEGVTTTTIIVPPTVAGGKYVGFSVGGGVEYAFTRNLLGRLQYIYDDFGSKNYVAADGGIYRVSLTSQTLRGALSWKF